MHASLLITDAAAVLQGIPLVSVMSLAYVQLAFVLAATQGGRRINNRAASICFGGHSRRTLDQQPIQQPSDVDIFQEAPVEWNCRTD